jgi:hypothetical protein
MGKGVNTRFYTNKQGKWHISAMGLYKQAQKMAYFSHEPQKAYKAICNVSNNAPNLTNDQQMLMTYSS